MYIDLDHQRKLAAWSRCRNIPNFDPNVWRWDSYGQPIKWTDHGNRQSLHGWEIDHIVPRAKGGADEHHNLQALHWRNNVVKGAH
jgi:5-methylcytosine-specific restriction endonuclease McrA